jgi:hypothetical protein
MELINSLLHCQQPASGLHPEQDQSCPHPPHLQSIVVTPSLYVCLPRYSFSASCLMNFLCLPRMPIMCFANAAVIAVSTVTRCQPGIPRVRIRAEVRESSLLREASIPALALIQPPVQLALITHGLKWQGHEADALTSNYCQVLHSLNMCAQHAKRKHHFTVQKTHCIPPERPINQLPVLTTRMKHANTVCDQNAEDLAVRTVLTHCGRVTQICVCTLQRCKTGDANLRF